MWRFILLFWFFCAGTACSFQETVEPTPLATESVFLSPTPTPTPEVVTGKESASPTVPPVVSEETDPILAACPVENQRRPFRDDVDIDLAALELNLCYDLDLVLNEAGDGFEASAQMTLRNGSSDPWPNLLFRLYPHSPLLFAGTIEIKSVEVNAQSVDYQRTLEDETGLLLPLEQSLLPGEHLVVETAFTGRLTREIGGDVQVYGIFARTDKSATIVSWFPLLAVWDAEHDRWFDVPVLGEGDAVFSETALMQATLSAPEQFDLAVSGTIIDEQQADGRNTYEVVTGPVRDLAMVWMDGYVTLEEEVDGTLVRHWYLAEHQEGAELALEAGVESLVLFNEAFGIYPFEEVDIIEVPLAGAGGVEYPQLYLLGQGLYPNSGSHDFLSFASSHEMAHQWWYSTVGSDINAAPWQDEALTNWSSLYWLESRQDGRYEAYQRSFERSVDEYRADKGDEPISQPLENFTERDEAYGVIVYLKGALFFEALREEIGDDAYFAALEAYYGTYRFDLAPPTELLTSFEKHSGRSLSEFYETWGVSGEK